MVFKNRLSQALEWAGMKQVDLAHKTGLSEAVIARYMKGDRKPSHDALRSIAKALRCTSDYLLELTDHPHDRYMTYEEKLRFANSDIAKDLQIRVRGTKDLDEDVQLALNILRKKGIIKEGQ